VKDLLIFEFHGLSPPVEWLALWRLWRELKGRSNSVISGVGMNESRMNEGNSSFSELTERRMGSEWITMEK